MPFDVTGTGTEQDLSVPDTTTVGLYRHTHNQGGGGSVDTDQLVQTWPALAAGTVTFTFGRRNGGNTAYVGPVITVVKEIDPAPPPPSDTTGPVVAWLAPKDGETVEGLEMFNYTVDDPSGIQSVEIRANTVLLTLGAPWDTTQYANGTAVTLELKATDNAPAHNVTTATITVTVQNPVVPVTTPKRTILIDLGQDGRQKYALWIPVPAALQTPPVGSPPSQWPLVSPAEQADLDSGAVREIIGYVQANDLTIEQLEAVVQARWQAETDRLLKVADWPYDDSYWDGVTWRKD